MTIEECMEKIPPKQLIYGIWGCLATLDTMIKLLESDLTKEELIEVLQLAIKNINNDLKKSGINEI